MGNKTEDDNAQGLPSTTLDAQGTTRTSRTCCFGCTRLQSLLSFRCVFVLLLGVALFLSALFWLPIFHFRDHTDLDLDYQGYDIIASFMLKKPVSYLRDYQSRLEDDIFDEMSYSNTKVQIISLEPSAGSNITKVVFSVVTDMTTQSLIRDIFVTLITHQSPLQLTAPLFGEPYSFDVLKFRGGITASPPDQKAYLMQRVQILFNFTLNFSIDEVFNNFGELSSQLKTGLHLTPYENLYIRLTNLRGSTVKPPTTVQAQVLLAVGINPSESRLKQLAQTITGSHTKNLGLNNTVFGRVKQVRLSSILQHSLGSEAPSASPSPSSSQSHHHHHHHQHHHHHHHDTSLAPSISPSPSTGKGRSVTRKRSPTFAPVPTPVPHNKKPAEPPGCRYGHNNPGNHQNKRPHVAPYVAPVYPPHAAPSKSKQKDSPAPKTPSVPAESPLSNVAHAHSQPPSRDEFHARPPDVLPLVSPSPSPSSAGVLFSNLMALPLLLLLLLCL